MPHIARRTIGLALAGLMAIAVHVRAGKPEGRGPTPRTRNAAGARPSADVLPQGADPLFVADELLLTARPREALAILEWVLARRPDDRAARALRARCRWALGQRRGALMDARHVVMRERRDAQRLGAMGRLAEQGGDARLADQAFGDALALAPKDQALLLAYADVRGRRGDTGGEVLLRRRLVRLSPRDPAMHLYLGLALIRDGAPRTARVVLERAHELGKDRPDVSLAAANAIRDLGSFGRARTILARAVRRWPGRTELRTAVGYLEAARGEFRRARQSFQAAVRASPGDAQPWIALGHLSRSRGHVHAARREYGEALRLAPDAPAVRLAIKGLDHGDGIPIRLGGKPAVSLHTGTNGTSFPAAPEFAVVEAAFLGRARRPTAAPFARLVVDRAAFVEASARPEGLPLIHVRRTARSIGRAFTLATGVTEDLEIDQTEAALSGTLASGYGAEMALSLQGTWRRISGERAPDLVREDVGLVSAGMVLTPSTDRLRFVLRGVLGKGEHRRIVLDTRISGKGLEVVHWFPAERLTVTWGAERDSIEATARVATIQRRRYYLVAAGEPVPGRQLVGRLEGTTLERLDPANIFTTSARGRSAGLHVRYDLPLSKPTRLALSAGTSLDLTLHLYDLVEWGFELSRDLGRGPNRPRLTVGAGMGVYPTLDAQVATATASLQTTF